MNQYRIDVNIADDHVMVCESLAEAISRADDIRVSHTFHSLEACRLALAGNRPDVLLLDISLPDGDGVAFCREIISTYPKLKIIATTIHDEYSVISRMLDVGVHGYVLKSSTIEQLVDAIRQVWQGERYLCPEVKAIVSMSKEHAVTLTDVERNILRMICEGMTNPQIAKAINLSTETINWYRKRLLVKYGVKNAAALATKVEREKLV